MHACTHACIYMYMYVYMYVCMYVCMHAHMHVYKNTDRQTDRQTDRKCAYIENHRYMQTDTCTTNYTDTTYTGRYINRQTRDR